MPENDDGTNQPDPAANLDDWIRRGPNVAPQYGGTNSVPGYGPQPGFGPPPPLQCFPTRDDGAAVVSRARRTSFLLGLLVGVVVASLVWVLVLLLV